MKYVIRTLLAALCFFVSAGLRGAEFRGINARFGISMRQAYSVCEDDYGFVWAATRTGIIRLSGDDYRTYRLTYEPEWLNVLSVKLDCHDSRLVAYTDNGQIYQYDPVEDDFRLVLNLGRLLSNSYIALFRVLVDGQGLWVASSAGLYRYQEGRLSRAMGLGLECFDIVRYDSRRLIVADSEGIRLYDTSIHRIEEQYDVDSGPALLRVMSLRFDPAAGRLWIGTYSEGLHCLDTESRTLRPTLASALPSGPIPAIAVYTDSTVLVGIDGQGVWEIAADGSRVLQVHKASADDPFSLPGNGVQDICLDSRGRVWVSTYSGGVSFFERNDRRPSSLRQFTHRINDPNSLANNNVSAVLEDSQGRLWFATDNGVSRYDPAADEWRNFYTSRSEYSQSFTSLCEDDRGRIWVGSLSAGLYVLDADTGREIAHYSRQTSRQEPMRFDFVNAIYKDSDGDIWVNDSRETLVRYHSAGERFISYPNDPVGVFGQLPDGKMVLGSRTGLSLLDKRTGHRSQILSGVLISDLLVEDNRIWLCTSGEGLLQYDYTSGSIVRRYTVADGLPSDYINSILWEDGRLWVGTESGVCRLDLSSGEISAFSSAGSLSIRSYNRQARFRLRSGELAWGTGDGAVVFAPQALQNTRSGGKLFFQDIYLAGRSIREGASDRPTVPLDSLTSITLPVSAGGFTLELLSVEAPGDAKISWKLEGIDRRWSTPADSRTITYTHLPGGTFRLSIRLWDGSLSHVIAERELTVRVARLFGGRVGALWAIGVLAAAIFLLWAARRYRRKAVPAEKAEGVPHELPLPDSPQERSDEDTGGPGVGEGQVWRLIRQAEPHRQAEAPQPLSDGQAAENDRFLKRVADVVTAHIADSGFGKEEFASAMHVSSSLLYKRLKALTDLSPRDFIRSARLNYAMELLRSGRYGVTEVSELCGFSSIGYFSTVFRKHFGRPPSDFIDKA